MKKLFTSLFIILACIACAPEDSIDNQPSLVDSEFINGHFTYVDSYNQFGVPANVEASTATLSFFLIDQSETGKPQGKVVWDFGDSKSKLNAWWRFDEASQQIAIFGERGTASFLGLGDDHFALANKWWPIDLTPEGHMSFRQCESDCIQWQFERQSDAGNWRQN